MIGGRPQNRAKVPLFLLVRTKLFMFVCFVYELQSDNPKNHPSFGNIFCGSINPLNATSFSFFFFVTFYNLRYPHLVLSPTSSDKL